MSLQIFQVDAFADKPFTGNPAAVCLIEGNHQEKYNTQWMQSLAAEMNLSETAFVEKKEDGHYHLRWFTPTIEVNLCGHATLASAHILWTETDLPTNQDILFDTLSGRLTISNNKGMITMDFPKESVNPLAPDEQITTQINTILSTDCLGVYKTNEDLLAEVESEDVLEKLSPDIPLLATLPIRCLIVTAKSKSDDLDFVSRVFAPAAGINEDPVTGSAHCSLAPFWASQLGKNTLLARQISARGGNLSLEIKNDRVAISGTAITILKGQLT